MCNKRAGKEQQDAWVGFQVRIVIHPLPHCRTKATIFVHYITNDLGHLYASPETRIAIRKCHPDAQHALSAREVAVHVASKLS